MLTALTANASSLFQTDTTTYLTRRVAERLFEDMRKQTDAKADSYDARIDPLTTRVVELGGRIYGYEKVQEAVSNGEKQIDDIQTALRDLWHIVNDAQNDPSASDYYSEAFNEKVQEINDIADRYSARRNLVGRPDPETLLPEPLTARLSDMVDETEFQGPYIGTSFYIEGTGADEGTFFQNSPGASVMKGVEELGGETTGETVGHSGGRLTDVAIGEDGSISFTLDEDRAFTGTLHQGGLNILPSWAYGELGSAEGIQAAFDAIEAATDTLRVARTSLGSIEAKAEREMAVLERQRDSLKREVSDLQDDKIYEIAEIEARARQEFNAVEASLQAGASAAGNYAKIMGAQANGLFTSFLT